MRTFTLSNEMCLDASNPYRGGVCTRAPALVGPHRLTGLVEHDVEKEKRRIKKGMRN